MREMLHTLSQQEARQLWRYAAIPIIFDDRPHTRLLVKLPYAADNRDWLRQHEIRKPVWQKQWQAWQIPRVWLERILQQCLSRYGRCYFIHPYREQERCAPACWNAVGPLCECSCLGQYHGSQAPGRWHSVNETCAIQWGPRQYACRLLSIAYERAAGTVRSVSD